MLISMSVLLLTFLLILSLSHDVLFDADLDVSHLVDVVVVYLYVVVNLLVVVVNLYVVVNLLVVAVNLYVVELYLFVVD